MERSTGLTPTPCSAWRRLSLRGISSERLIDKDGDLILDFVVTGGSRNAVSVASDDHSWIRGLRVLPTISALVRLRVELGLRACSPRYVSLRTHSGNRYVPATDHIAARDIRPRLNLSQSGLRGLSGLRQLPSRASRNREPSLTPSTTSTVSGPSGRARSGRGYTRCSRRRQTRC